MKKELSLNDDMVEATINQLVAELNQQVTINKEMISAHRDNKDDVSEAFAEGVNKGLSIALIHLRKLHSDLIWKQLSLKLMTVEKECETLISKK
tara:strand:+ start:94 stop:375 length:282 start_codon:yes stop_codon:yes gene_type:complete